MERAKNEEEATANSFRFGGRTRRPQTAALGWGGPFSSFLLTLDFGCGLRRWYLYLMPRFNRKLGGVQVRSTGYYHHVDSELRHSCALYAVYRTTYPYVVVRRLANLGQLVRRVRDGRGPSGSDGDALRGILLVGGKRIVVASVQSADVDREGDRPKLSRVSLDGFDVSRKLRSAPRLQGWQSWKLRNPALLRPSNSLVSVTDIGHGPAAIHGKVGDAHSTAAIPSGSSHTLCRDDATFPHRHLPTRRGDTRCTGKERSICIDSSAGKVTQGGCSGAKEREVATDAESACDPLLPIPPSLLAPYDEDI